MWVHWIQFNDVIKKRSGRSNYTVYFPCQQMKMMSILVEKVDKGALENQVIGKLSKEEYNIWRALEHLPNALKYLHALRPIQFLHRDLKPVNILGMN